MSHIEEHIEKIPIDVFDSNGNPQQIIKFQTFVRVDMRAGNFIQPTSCKCLTASGLLVEILDDKTFKVCDTGEIWSKR